MIREFHFSDRYSHRGSLFFTVFRANVGNESRAEVDDRLGEFTWNLGTLEEGYGMQGSPLPPHSVARSQLYSSLN